MVLDRKLQGTYEKLIYLMLGLARLAELAAAYDEIVDDYINGLNFDASRTRELISFQRSRVKPC